MGYSVAPHQFTLAASTAIGLTYSINNGEWVGAAIMYGFPNRNSIISEMPCDINWGQTKITYSSEIKNFSPFPVTLAAHLAWVDL
jgi:hypothetical protein